MQENCDKEVLRLEEILLICFVYRAELADIVQNRAELPALYPFIDSFKPKLKSNLLF